MPEFKKGDCVSGKKAGKAGIIDRQPAADGYAYVRWFTGYHEQSGAVASYLECVSIETIVFIEPQLASLNPGLKQLHDSVMR